MRAAIATTLLFSIAQALLAKEPGASFLEVNSSVRAQALGGVSTAAQGAQAVGSNPALVTPLSSRSEVDASFLQLLGDTANGRVAYAAAMNPKRSWGFAATLMDAGKTSGRDALGQPTHTNTVTHHETGTGAFSTRVGRGCRLGLAGTLYQSTLAGESSGVSWAVDAGLSLTVKKFLFGVSANRLGPNIKYIDQEDPLPSVLLLDTSWTPGPLTVLAGYHRSLAGSGSQGILGTEYRLGGLALRAGLRAALGGTDDLALKNQSTANQLLDNLTTGFGLRLGKSLRMDYAFQQIASDWGPSHSLSLTWAWGEKPKRKSPPKTMTKSKPTPPKPTAKKKPLPPREKLGK